jgi:hypothetical protein
MNMIDKRSISRLNNQHHFSRGSRYQTLNQPKTLPTQSIAKYGSYGYFYFN